MLYAICCNCTIRRPPRTLLRVGYIDVLRFICHNPQLVQARLPFFLLHYTFRWYNEATQPGYTFAYDLLYWNLNVRSSIRRCSNFIYNYAEELLITNACTNQIHSSNEVLSMQRFATTYLFTDLEVYILPNVSTTGYQKT